jgi:steroid delta-isomerase-like uncharacterized protein
MTREEITAIFDRRSEAMDRRDIEALGAIYAEDCVVVSPMAGGAVAGPAGVEQVFRAWFGAFPDVVHRKQSLLIDGDQVATVELITGTDTGGFMGMAPTQKSFELPLVHLYQLRDGLIVHERRIYDFTGMLVQIGVLKAKPA